MLVNLSTERGEAQSGESLDCTSTATHVLSQHKGFFNTPVRAGFMVSGVGCLGLTPVKTLRELSGRDTQRHRN